MLGIMVLAHQRKELCSGVGMCALDLIQCGPLCWLYLAGEEGDGRDGGGRGPGTGVDALCPSASATYNYTYLLLRTPYYVRSRVGNTEHGVSPHCEC